MGQCRGRDPGHDVRGVTLSAYGGLSRVVAHGACTGDQCDRVDRLMLPYAGFALGHTL